MIFDKYPYTDFHELNLDWIIATIKEMDSTMDTFTALNTVTWAGDWDPDTTYPAWSIVRDADGSAYISLKVVPAGVLLTDSDYWALAFDYDVLYQDFIARMDSIENTTEQMIEAGKQETESMIDDARTEFTDMLSSTSTQLTQVIAEQETLSQRMDTFTQLPTGSTSADAELMDIRVGADGITYPSAGDAVRTQFDNVNEDLEETQDWLAYPRSRVDLRDFTITNSSNWTISSSTPDSMTVVHRTTYSTGFPSMPLNLPDGRYRLDADFSGSSYKMFALSVNNADSPLRNGNTFVVDNTNTYRLRFAPTAVETFVITDVKIVKINETGKIPEIEADIGEMKPEIAALQNGFNSIATEKIEPISGTETEYSALNPDGSLFTAGSAAFRTIKYSVTPFTKYYVTANAAYGSLLWAFYNSANAVIELGDVSTSSPVFVRVTDEEIISPADAAYLILAYNTGVETGSLKTITGYDFSFEKPWIGMKWVCVGDSLTAINATTTKRYFEYVAEKTGISTVNLGIDGAGYARKREDGDAFYQKISLVPLDSDVVTIFGSFNDLGSGLPLGSVDDTGTASIAGCINTTITNLQAIIPLVNLGIVAPTPWQTTQPSTSGAAFDYVEMLKAICERRSIPFLDLWRSSNLRPWDADFRAAAYSRDGGGGTHPDENGHKLIAPRFESFLKSLLLV